MSHNNKREKKDNYNNTGYTIQRKVRSLLPHRRFNLTEEEYDNAHRFFQGVLNNKNNNNIMKIDELMEYIGLFKSKYENNLMFDQIEEEKSKNIEECGKFLGYFCMPFKCCCKTGKLATKIFFIILLLASIVFIFYFLSRKIGFTPPPQYVSPVTQSPQTEPMYSQFANQQKAYNEHIRQKPTS